MSTRQDGPFVQTPTTAECINLGLGQPSPRLLPLEAIADAASAALGPDADRLILQYGNMRGPRGARERLADLWSRRGSHRIGADELVITAGNSLSLALASAVFRSDRATVVCGDPTYFLARGIFETEGLNIESVEVDSGGLNTEQLEERLADGSLRPDFVYCIPQYHNPCGVSLSPQRAEHLVSLAERYDFVVLSDEPYVLLHFGPNAPASLYDIDGGRGRVLALGTFSKILGPGLRLGWACGTEALLARFVDHGTFRSGGGLNPVVGAVVDQTIASGVLDRHIDHLRETLGSRARRMCDELSRHLPQARFERPEGGYFVWVDLGHEVDTASVLETAKERGVAFVPGTRCGSRPGLSRHLRLSFSFYEEDEIAQGIATLAEALAETR